ncbi:hypothetical protein [Hymenobacter sp. YC55]|nr:hypothetical protein [Hymenobacter sp. YC55]
MLLPQHAQRVADIEQSRPLRRPRREASATAAAQFRGEPKCASLA